VQLSAAPAKDNADRYGRLLRYVDVGGVDAGLQELEAGFAVARYDSRDGYGAHPREASYIATDQQVPSYSCNAATPAGSR
jgi:endonuclease YncB( thermonuclease family)